MSYWKYRQRNASGRAVATVLSATTSSQKLVTVESEDEEQVTQEGSFTGQASNRSTPAAWQMLNSSRRTSRMGRLKSAPVRILVLFIARFQIGGRGLFPGGYKFPVTPVIAHFPTNILTILGT